MVYCSHPPNNGKRQFVVKKRLTSMADGRSLCSSEADAVHVLEPESSSLNGKLVWMNDLESLKKFGENVLKLQGKWLTPGGNTKQSKCSNDNVIINWYSKKQRTLNFQGRDGPL